MSKKVKDPAQFQVWQQVHRERCALPSLLGQFKITTPMHRRHMPPLLSALRGFCVPPESEAVNRVPGASSKPYFHEVTCPSFKQKGEDHSRKQATKRPDSADLGQSKTRQLVSWYSDERDKYLEACRVAEWKKKAQKRLLISKNTDRALEIKRDFVNRTQMKEIDKLVKHLEIIKKSPLTDRRVKRAMLIVANAGKLSLSQVDHKVRKDTTRSDVVATVEQLVVQEEKDDTFVHDIRQTLDMQKRQEHEAILKAMRLEHAKRYTERRRQSPMLLQLKSPGHEPDSTEILNADREESIHTHETEERE